MRQAAFDYDVVIVGAGMVGATLGCLLAQQGRRVALIERAVFTPFVLDPHSMDKPNYGLRVSAISHASQQAFIDVGAWDVMSSLRVTPYENMHVWDATGQGEIHFSAADIAAPELGTIIENQVIQTGLFHAMDAYDTLTVLAPASVTAFQVDDKAVKIELSNGDQLTTALLVGADGAQSKVRQWANIVVQKNDYYQKGLVAVVKTEMSHQFTAWQRFMPSGPLAFLPLNDHLCSVVWTLPADKADYYLAMSDETFNTAISAALDHRLGQVNVVSKRAAFPLVGQQAEHYMADGVALVGDAAHTIHPLAGQGVNLGIKDTVVLADQLSSLSHDYFQQEKIMSNKILRRYERARRGDNVMTQKAMEGFKLLFGNRCIPLQVMRNMGLRAMNQLTPMKNEVMRRAMGL